MEEQSVSVRTALMPLCYKDFRCLAGACRDNCCGGWEISFNKKDYLHIKRSARSPELKELLSGGMSRLREKEHDGLYAQFRMDDAGQCPFQTAEGLCRLQLECGEAVLPRVCRIYPRKHTYTPAGYEFALSPSCEGVLALLWDLPQGIDFLEEDLPKQDWRQVLVAPGWVRFADIRSFCVDVLQERSLPLSRRMLLLGLLLQQLKETRWREDEAEVDRWLARAGEQLVSSPPLLDGLTRDRLKFLVGNLRTLVELYQRETAHREVWRELFAALSAVEDWESVGFSRFSIDTLRYERLEGQLADLLGHSDAFFENLMVMTAFYQTFPDLLDPETLWKSYVELCVLYGFFRFAAVCGCYREVSRERLFQVLGAASRGLLHNKGRRDRLVDGLLENGEASLAHMAVLVGG